MVTPGGMRLAEDIPSSYYHSDRMVAAVAVSMAPLTVPMARWWPPHGIPIGYGSRDGRHGGLHAAAWWPPPCARMVAAMDAVATAW